jgi:hypothetical protein
MNTLMGIYYKPNMTNDLLRLWFHKLEAFTLDEVVTAVNYYTDQPRTSEFANPPQPTDILQICRNKRVTIHARLPSPLAIAENKEKADELAKVVNEQMRKKSRDPKQWARDLVSGKTKSNCDWAIEAAKKALGES